MLSGENISHLEALFQLSWSTEIIYYCNNRAKQRIGIKAVTERGA